MLSRISKALTGRTLYDQFELIVSGIVLFLVSAVIVFTTILTTIELIRDFLMGMKFLDAEVFKDTFGLILTILILLEFNHSIVSALRQRAGSIQVSIIVLITITVIARKLILLDYASATPETLLGLEGGTDDACDERVAIPFVVRRDDEPRRPLCAAALQSNLISR